MKSFLTAALFFVATVVATAFLYEGVSVSASEAYSMPSVRVGPENSADGRLGGNPGW